MDPTGDCSKRERKRIGFRIFKDDFFFLEKWGKSCNAHPYVDMTFKRKREAKCKDMGKCASQHDLCSSPRFCSQYPEKSS